MMKNGWHFDRLLVVLLVLILAFSGVFACSRMEDDRAAKPDIEKAEAVISGSNQLAFELLEGLREADDENVVISPLSVSALLAILLNGAGGDTASAIADVLHLDDPSPDEARRLGHLLRYLISRDEDVQLLVANGVWADSGQALTGRFAQVMEEDFDAYLKEVDLESPEAARNVDRWVYDKTNGCIEKMSDALGLPDPSAVAVLMNAIYFKGSWSEPFDPEETHNGEFTRGDGSTVDVSFMSKTGTYCAASRDGYEVLKIPYGESEQFGMHIFLPDRNSSLTDMLRKFDAAIFDRAVADLSEGRFKLEIPKLELEYEATKQLDGVLKALGMGIAYSAESDFTPMSPRDPWLSRVAHKTYIRVDEEGTEAAGVTGGVMVESMPATFRADRPFLFTISDCESGVILFMGAVTDPLGK